MTKVSYTPQDKNAKLKRELAMFLRRHTDQRDWATAEHSYSGGTLQKRISRRNTRAAILAAFDSKDWRYLDEPKNRDYFAHFEGESHLYAAGRPFSRKEFKERGQVRTLVYIDVDCKTSGSAEGSLALVQFIASDECRSAYGFSFPGLYSEPSSNKRGRAAWFLLDYGNGDGQANIRPCLRSLADLLNKVAQDRRFDVEHVEIKSTPSLVRWSDSVKNKVDSLTMGTLARLPRSAESVKELKATTVLTIQDLQRLPRPEKFSTAKVLTDFDERNETVRSAGSSTGSLLSEDRFERLPFYRGLAAKIMGGADAVIQTSGRMVSNVEDMAVVLLILEACSENMNEDGSLPTARIKAIWTQAYKSGRVERSYHRARFSVLRDKLSSLGLLEVEDMSFRIGTEREKGQACKWKLSDVLLTWMEKVRSVAGQEGVKLSLVQHENVDAFSSLTPSDDYPRPTPVFDRKDYLSPFVLAEIDRIVGTWTPSTLAA